jgi:fumarate reductase flavoprotein subunit
MKKRLISLVLAGLTAVSLFTGCSSTAVFGGKSPDVLIIGGGGAGMVSAITAAENGAKVVLVEKMPMLGGNTLVSATGITASDTKLHKEANKPFTVEDHVKKTMETGKNLPDEKLVRLLAQKSNESYEWLVSLGLKFKLDPKDVTWIIPQEGFYGSLLVDAYKAQLDKNKKNLDVKLETKATELVMENGKVVGAKVQDKTGKVSVIKAKSVILATGGLGNAPELIAQYNPKYKGAHSVMSTPGPTGDGIKMAVAAGAALKDMEYHQMRPLATASYWVRETVLSEKDLGGVLVNTDGKRFTNETLKPLDLVPQILAQKDRTAFVIFDSNIAATSNGEAAVKKANMIKADTIEELAQKLKLKPEVVKATIEEYNAGKDEFKRETLGKVLKAPFYGVQVFPSSHYTMGGIAINEKAQVLNKDGKVIEGLFAAGETVGGLYGSGRVAGNNTLDDIVFGKIAGKTAAGK